MKIITTFRQTILVIALLSTSFAYGQNNDVKIKAKWIVDKFEFEDSTAHSSKAQQEMQGTYFTFGEDLLLSKKTDTGEIVIKRGPYRISENTITLGKDEAKIVELTEYRLTIKIPNQGVLYLTKF